MHGVKDIGGGLNPQGERTFQSVKKKERELAPRRYSFAEVLGLIPLLKGGELRFGWRQGRLGGREEKGEKHRQQSLKSEITAWGGGDKRGKAVRSGTVFA